MDNINRSPLCHFCVICCRKVEKNKGIKSNKGINFYCLHMCGRTPTTGKKLNANRTRKTISLRGAIYIMYIYYIYILVWKAQGNHNRKNQTFLFVLWKTIILKFNPILHIHVKRIKEIIIIWSFGKGYYIRINDPKQHNKE